MVLQENSIVLPRTDFKKLPCKYSLKEPLDATFSLPKVQECIQDIGLMVSTETYY